MITNVPRYLVVGTLVPITGLLLLLATSFGSSRRLRDPKAPAAAAASTAATEVAELRRELRAVETRQNLVAAALQAHAPVPTDAPEPEPAARQRPDPVEAERRADETAVAQLDLLEKSFAAQPQDSTWSTAAARKLSAAFPKGPAKLDDVECATTMCRVTIVADKQQDVELAFRQFNVSLPWNAQGFAHSSGKGAPLAKFYFMREGQKLPLADGTTAEL